MRLASTHARPRGDLSEQSGHGLATGTVEGGEADRQRTLSRGDHVGAEYEAFDVIDVHGVQVDDAVLAPGVDVTRIGQRVCEGHTLMFASLDTACLAALGAAQKP